MLAYRCWHYLCRETARVVYAKSSFEARQEAANALGVAVSDIVSVAVRYE